MVALVYLYDLVVQNCATLASATLVSPPTYKQTFRAVFYMSNIPPVENDPWAFPKAFAADSRFVKSLNIDSSIAHLSFHRYIDPCQIPKLEFANFTGSFAYFGPDNVALADKAATYCRDVAHIKGDLLPVFTAFLDHVRAEHLPPWHTSLWLSVRVAQPCNVFDIPHWHQDGRYFTPSYNRPAHKISAVISGSQTLFLDVEPWYQHFFSRMFRANMLVLIESAARVEEDKLPRHKWPAEGTDAFELRRKSWVDHCLNLYRTTNASLLENSQLRLAEPGQVSKWLVGDDPRSIVHSEPPLTSPRLIVTALPGTEKEIKELCEKWGEAYGDISDFSGYDGHLMSEYHHVSAIPAIDERRLIWEEGKYYYIDFSDRDTC